MEHMERMLSSEEFLHMVSLVLTCSQELNLDLEQEDSGLLQWVVPWVVKMLFRQIQTLCLEQ